MLAALRFRAFRLLWMGQSASMFGDSMILVAIGLFVTDLTGNPSDVGLVLAAYTVPLVGFLLVGGVIADRFPRRLVMIVSDLVRAVLHGVLALLIAFGAVEIWHMMVIGALFSTAEAFFRPAYSGLLPQTVPEDHIQQAQALGGLSREVASFVSPAVATALVLGVGGAAAFAFDALTFVVSALLLARVQARARGEVTEKTSFLLELREGWHAVRERTWVWATVLAFSLALFLMLGPFFVLGATVSKDVYGTPAVFGLTSAAWGVGTVTGVVIGARWRPLYPMRAGMLAVVPWPLGTVAFALGPPPALLYALIAVLGVGIGLFAVWWETALATRIPPHLLSRVSAWDWMGSLALLPIGYLVAGPVAARLGGTRTLIGGALMSFVIMAMAVLPRDTRMLRRIEPEGDAPVISPEAPRATAPLSG
ncbi:MAG TPA: MFS transporter [Mycobacteriales bacterium]|nr:MFS transporter [Mycobacteriales bacterium]